MFRKLLYNLNIIKKEHWVQPFVYIDKNSKPTRKITDKVKWIGEETYIKCKKKDYLNKLHELKEKYENIDDGKYKGRINFY